MEYAIKRYYSYCCNSFVYLKDSCMGLFCSGCNKEVFNTVDKGKDE